MLLESGIELPTQAIAELCRRYHVHELSVFGSAARGDMKPESDIDILVEFEPDAPIGLWEFGHIEGELSVLLGRKVDLVSKRGLKPRVRPYVLRDAKVVYAA
ncbi:MAG TPA: nucleotidyltransferase family protein [Bryobacteraceae bacterium]